MLTGGDFSELRTSLAAGLPTLDVDGLTRGVPSSPSQEEVRRRFKCNHVLTQPVHERMPAVGGVLPQVLMAAVVHANMLIVEAQELSSPSF